MDLTLPAYTEYLVETQDTQRLMEEMDRQAICLQQLLQRNPRLKIQITIDTIEYSIMQEDEQMSEVNERTHEDSENQQTIQEARSYLQQRQPDPECIMNLPVQENLEYYWQKYKDGDSCTRERIALWTHFVIGKRLSQYQDEL